MNETILNKAEQFLFTLDKKFRMISRDELLLKYSKKLDKQPLIIDFRGAEAYQKCHIKGSINLDIKKLPESIHQFDKEREIVAVCNGSIQSGYAIFYLYLKGFHKVFNLSGGFSGCEKNDFPLLIKQ